MGAYRHLPAFDRLCEYAKKAGLQVRLPVITGITIPQFGRKRGETYRLLARIEIWVDNTAPAIAAEIRDGDLEAAALDLLRRAA